ncbi:tRNA 2-selenouridine synthase [Cyclobacterium xiamenense]|uniref:tRNA 2-selenouridine synthase n=1 Tax=Cyclobacterium xiamenense TaxID=1297121 RepID=A0A1H6XS67_9BACT|nr:tRNA 2-selenouridine(34) synthase MnmH [Cyclobacterium xiamenense]SEJ31879.1 tRNA 2-selenouridine synthase [Cyclobacterium xiamenense]
MKEIEAREFLAHKHAFPVLDTRSPAEYEQGHVPGAVSFPLFENTERETIGKLYKEKGKQAAISEGLRITGPKMADFIERAVAFDAQHFLLHCWRGGMRSQSIAWLLELYGFSVWIMKGGYKAYRNSLLSYFEDPPPLRVLTGATGSMKTAMLKQLRLTGEQVVDLEALANHQGSSFGNQLSTGQPTTEQFQNDLFEAFLALDPKKPVWIEDESFSIGRVHLIEPLYRNMQLAPHYHLELPLEKRIDVLLRDYGQLSEDKLITAIQGIARKLGVTNTGEAIARVEAGELGRAAAIVLNYYDRAYRKGIQQKSDKVVGKFYLTGENLEETAQILINYGKRAH